MTPTDIELDPSQERAVELLLEAPICVVTGGPGTGKTTIVRTALSRLRHGSRPTTCESCGGDGQYGDDDDPAPIPCFVCGGSGKMTSSTRTALAAPTGKAAKRLSEATGRPAQTIHRLLEYGPVGKSSFGFRRCAQNPLEEDLVICDEASMICVELAAALLDAIDAARTRLVLVGDADQLPPVGPGRPFADLIESGRVPVARLTTVHRAAARSWVCRNAPRVLAGAKLELEPQDDFWRDLVPSSADIPDRVVELVTSRLPAHGATDVQVLAPQRTLACGIDAINVALQRSTNPPRRGELTWGRTPHELRIGDRVIQTQNDYTRAVFNGELGRIVELAKKQLVVQFEGREPVAYDRLSASQLQLAYALTVHKCQGSEWPWAVVVCHSTHTRMLSRQLLYTAITRAKTGVVLVGDDKGLERALKHAGPARRNTTLTPRLGAEVERRQREAA